MAEELARKKRVRGGHKSSATRMITRVEEMLAAGGNLDLSKLNQLGMSIKEKLEEIKVLDCDVLALVGDTELDDEIAQADLYKERIYSILISIEKATELEPPSTATSTSASSTATLPILESGHSNKVRLPKLMIMASSLNGALSGIPLILQSMRTQSFPKLISLTT